jgi:hypothetical protein
MRAVSEQKEESKKGLSKGFIEQENTRLSIFVRKDQRDKAELAPIGKVRQ